ncbi:MAG TPA: TMEM165/GDT1 family protein [Dissulfurispiraceae bacterium]|nr:TMEM165/GDT1 family protein [Dissulfurispiraceae bacterium]
MVAFITSLVFVVLAEMGDKTQLLAMCFAMKYRWQTVMWGVFAATAANHLLAVLLGTFLTTFVPMSWVNIAASVSFIIFGLWTIRGDTLNCADDHSGRSPFWVVTISFFIAECGDKTQLATVALAAQYNTVLPVWLGTTAGMMIADAIGIIFGVVMGRRIPENAVKWFAALIFIAFGIFGLYETVPREYLRAPLVIGLLAAVAGAVGFIVRINRRQRQASTDEPEP